MVIEFGTRVIGRTVLIPREIYDRYELVHGSIYQIEMVTGGVRDPDTVINHLSRERYDRFRLRVIWAMVSDPYIYVQVIPNHPAIWILVLAALPLILKAVGVLLLAASVFLLILKALTWQIMAAIIAAIATYGVVEILTRR